MPQAVVNSAVCAANCRDNSKRANSSESFFRRKKCHFHPRIKHRDSLRLMGRPGQDIDSKDNIIDMLDADEVDDEALDKYLSNLVLRMSKESTSDSSCCYSACSVESSNTSFSDHNEKRFELVINNDDLFSETGRGEIESGKHTKEFLDVSFHENRRRSVDDRCFGRCLDNKINVATTMEPVNPIQIEECPSDSRCCVEFGIIEIREYSIEIGDNPACASGPALSVGWEYVTVLQKTLHAFEEERSPRRRNQELFVSPDSRMEKLRSAGFAEDEITLATKRIAVDRVNRMKTLINLKYYRYEKTFESAMRKTSRLVRPQKRDKELIKYLRYHVQTKVSWTSGLSKKAQSSPSA